MSDQPFNVIAELLRQLREAQAERDAWRDVIAILCRDGGQYHQQHGTAATRQHCIDVVSELRRENDALRERVVSVYERYKHLDRLVSDPNWSTDSAEKAMTAALWQAIDELALLTTGRKSMETKQ